jgi:hypothetical protein
MCDFRTLHLDAKLGYVLQCIHCNDITIGFGILTFSRSLDEFHMMVQDVHECHDFHRSMGYEPESRNIPFWQLNECSCVTLSLNELRQLGELLDLASARLMLDQLLLNLPEN